MIKEINKNFAEISITNGPYALVEFSRIDDSTRDSSPNTISTGAGTPAEYMQWGSKDDLPLQREWLIEKNNIVPSLLKTRRDLSTGHGIEAYRKIYENGQVRKELVELPPKIKEFFERVNIEEVLSHFHREIYLHSNCWIEGIMTKDLKNVYSIEVKRCRHMRSGLQNQRGKVDYHLYNRDFGDNKNNRKENNEIKAEKIPAIDWSAEKYPKKWAAHLTDDILYDEYYPTPTWWGGRKWIELANIIPSFHLANLKHGYSLRYHIEIPNDYFAGDPSEKTTAESKKKSEEREEEAKREFLDRLNDFLAGADNAGRAIVTYYDVNHAMQKEFPGVKITPLKADLHDEALLKLFEKSNQANISGQSIHPTLANIETQGKLSSGSEIRNAYLMYLAIHTTYTRRLFLQFLTKIGQVNGWPKDIHLGIKNIEMITLDEDKTGHRETVNE